MVASTIRADMAVPALASGDLKGASAPSTRSPDHEPKPLGSVSGSALIIRSTMWRTLALLAMCALAVGCGDRFHTVAIKNETDSSYILAIVWDSGGGYPTEVPGGSLGWANEPMDGKHPDRYILFDATCRTIASGTIDDDDVGILISEGDVAVERHPAWEVSGMLPYTYTDCGAFGTE